MIELIHRWSEVIFSDRLQAPEKEWKYVKPKINRFKCHLTSWLHERNWIVVQSLSCVQLFVTPWTAARQASLSFTISWSLLKLISIESDNPTISSSVIPFSCLQSFPASGSFLTSRLFTSGGQSIGASASASNDCVAVAQRETCHAGQRSLALQVIINWDSHWACALSNKIYNLLFKRNRSLHV